MDRMGNAAMDFTGGAAAGLSAQVEPGHVLFETYYDVVCFDADGNIRWVEKTENRVVTVGLNKLLDATFKTGLTSPAWYVGIVGPEITDAAITSGAAALTSATNPWTSVDAGQPIIVRGAGAAGADLVTTILSYSSAGAVTLAANAGTTVTGASALWGARAADTMASHSPWTENQNYSQSTRPALTLGTIAAGSVDNSASPATFSINTNGQLIGGLFIADNSTKGGTTGVLYGMAPFSSVGFRQLNNGDSLAVTATLTAAAA